VPLFDRERDIAVAGASVIEAADRVILLEGNYLLLRRQPWDALRAFVDLDIWLDVPLDVPEARLVQRWLDHGHEPLLVIRTSGPAAVTVVNH
jgi:pantothenate kinase